MSISAYNEVLHNTTLDAKIQGTETKKQNKKWKKINKYNKYIYK